MDQSSNFKSDVESKLRGNGKSFKNALEDFQRTTGNTFADAKDQIVTASVEAVQKIDRSAHNKPWAFVGIAAACCGILGYSMGRKARNK